MISVNCNKMPEVCKTYFENIEEKGALPNTQSRKKSEAKVKQGFRR